jgi:beta-lactamase superfamily II metal-dependent hydrolase
VLLCSDIEKTAQAQLLKKFPDLCPNAVIVPHHGSLRTRLPDFLDSINADVLIYSCDQRQYDLLKKSARPKSFYTCDDGAVTVSIGTNGKTKTSSFVLK